MLIALVFAQAAAATMVMPAFLSGCWEEKRDAGGWTEECWTDARGNLMIGSGRDGGDGGITSWEWMRIQRAADGSITLHASPKGATAVPFKAVDSSATAITFVNADHDYPQRISYRLTANGLQAEISLISGAKPVKWLYRRTAGAAK